MRISNKIVALGLASLMLLVFFLMTAFYFSSDNLIKYIPQDTFFYLHLDQAGLKNNWLKQVLKEISPLDSNLNFIGKNLSTENIFLFDEVGLVNLLTNTPVTGIKGDFILLLRFKNKDQLADFLAAKRFTGVSKKLDKYTLALGLEPAILDFTPNNLFGQPSFLGNINNLFKQAVGRGHINLSSLDRLMKDGPDNLLENELINFNIYLNQELKKLSFIFDQPPTSKNQIFDLMENIQLTKTAASFVFIFPSSTSLETLEKNIQTKLAWQKPIEKEIILPDGSTYLELVADPSIFHFTKKQIQGKELHYWQEIFLEAEDSPEFDQSNLEIVIWQDNQYTFISNTISLFNKLTTEANPCFSSFQKQDFKKAVYFQINKFKIQDLILTEILNKINGCLNIENF
ncbi:hypothetical protein IID20_00165 [Patescibacteria group bacterium]|nr:hypothetical protein [Patescibacteria group bacterium]